MSEGERSSDRVRYVISVLVADRVGILKGITSAIADMGGDIDAISQTVVEGYFTVILTASFPAPCPAEEVHRAILAGFPRNEVSVVVRPFEPPPARGRPSGVRYILTIQGREQAGILKRVCTYLAGKGINIEDLFFRIDGPRVTHVGEVMVPRVLDIKQVQDELGQLLAPLGLSASLQHENIFTVTSEVGSVRPLLEEGRRA